jgi:predicted nucleotidyltransferase component of viral defense system
LPREKILAKKIYRFFQKRQNKPIIDVCFAKKKSLAKKRYRFFQKKIFSQEKIQFLPIEKKNPKKYKFCK